MSKHIHIHLSTNKTKDADASPEFERKAKIKGTPEYYTKIQMNKRDSDPWHQGNKVGMSRENKPNPYPPSSAEAKKWFEGKLQGLLI
jgi:hypothetical protein